MLIDFLLTLRQARLPVSVREYLTLLDGLRQGVVPLDVDGFYQWGRLALVKDEALYDRYDQAFGQWWRGVQAATDPARPGLPEDWLRRGLERLLSAEERAQLQALDWDTLMRTLAERLAEQRERHEGGSKWIGTGGSSPFGAFGENPRGIRIGQPTGRKRSAVKVWDERAFQDYADDVELDTRQIKVALRRLRRFARQGEATELDLDGTLHATAANAGLLDLRLRPERRNQIKVLLLMDVGGTMDDHVQRVQELFSAARSEFKHLEFFYFHNCVYERVWKDNRRRRTETTPTADLLHRYNRDWRLVFVGDATMSPYEILQPGGSVEHHNPEPGARWIERLTEAFPRHVWINPEPQALWAYRQSVTLVRQMVHERMVPLTLSGLDQAMRLLGR
ncbi:MAG: hypothetical protein RIQ53_4741 [Pseudomonadota bacterium]